MFLPNDFKLLLCHCSMYVTSPWPLDSRGTREWSLEDRQVGLRQTISPRVFEVHMVIVM